MFAMCVELIKNKDKYNGSTFILAGDCGILSRCDIEELGTISDMLINNNCDYKFYLMRGNHEDRRFYNNKTVGLFTLLRDYSIIEYDILVIGGAMLHREFCYRRSQYEKQAVEQLDDEVLHLIVADEEIKYVISHQAPSIIEFDFDDKLEDARIDAEREYLTKVYNIINPRLWVHGHIHQYKVFNNIISLDEIC
jgi:hypothetical protein